MSSVTPLNTTPVGKRVWPAGESRSSYRRTRRFLVRPIPAPISASPARIEPPLSVPVNASDELGPIVVVVGPPNVTTDPDDVVVTPGIVDEVPPAVVTVPGTVVDDATLDDDEALVDVVDGSELEDVDDTATVDVVVDVDVDVEVDDVVVVEACVVVVVGADGSVHPLSNTAIPLAVQFFPG